MLYQINMELEINFTLVQYMRLSEAITFFLAKKEGIALAPAVPIGISVFLTSFEKGSSRVRQILCKKKVENIKVLNIPSVTTFINLTQTGPIAEENLIKSLLGYWNFSGQSNPMREFIFKFLYNQLGLNCRVAHFVAGHGRPCTLCTIAQRNNPSDETFLHLFYDCPTTTTLREKLANKHF
jgi:hypothetical protein